MILAYIKKFSKFEFFKHGFRRGFNKFILNKEKRRFSVRINYKNHENIKESGRNRKDQKKFSLSLN